MKKFVLDTNVILHDSEAIYSFGDNDIYIPIVVLEELDKFKKGSDQINYNAREFIRELDKITDDRLFIDGASLGEGKGRLYIDLGEQYDEEIGRLFPNKKPDHRILSTVKTIADKDKDILTIFVTKDVNLRMKAKAVGLETQDYFTDKVQNVGIFEENVKEVLIDDGLLIDRAYKKNVYVTPEMLGMEEDPVPNSMCIMTDGNSSILLRYDAFESHYIQVEKTENAGIKPRNSEQTFAFDLLNDRRLDLIAMTGRAGTGKTLLALASALKQASRYKQILLMRPIVSLSDKDIGFLPGNEKDKIKPYMQPLFDNLNVIKYQGNDAVNKEIEQMLADEKLSIEALAYIRGRSLSETFCIIDEAQNLTPHEIKTIITRAGEGTKMVFTGDIHQIDSPYLDIESNGLAYMIEKMQGENVFAHINLVKGERSELAELASQRL